ncbi:inosine-uridine preferring nucleoside hydrolase isoform X3 [Caretta caretta]|uniref:inosine-uridine preferring nucleoside hydrolase isoform X3 n=1 Tax=Caretta caretta TaxID=8467 RepID=UPI0020947AF7|nr:inosine-uridine preferring nucleoside hydrolase-like isoform X3 [Caretta caretta]
MTKLLLIDVDCGVDDAQAIMMALASPSVEILGITCCYGNTQLENVCKNVLRVLQVCNRLEISLVATGPLTNLALAVKLDPTFPMKLKNMFIMGGNIESRGNTTICGEFNFATDPEAAYVVLNEFTCPTYIASWEFTCHNSLSWEFYREWVNQDTKKAKFMEKISAHSIKFTESKHENTGNMLWTSGFVSCDSYAMAAAIDESFVTKAIEVAVSVELNGSLTRGMMVMDMTGLLKKKNKAFVINKCDLEKFKELLIAALK